jgi:hypothetical protein
VLKYQDHRKIRDVKTMHSVHAVNSYIYQKVEAYSLPGEGSKRHPSFASQREDYPCASDVTCQY